jgi:hypothetical protein
VDVLVKSVPPGAGGTVRISLAGSGGEVLAGRDVPLASISPLSILTLPVDPTLAVGAGSYAILLSSADISLASSPGFAVNQPDLYPAGQLNVAGLPASPEGDLIFHYSCPAPSPGWLVPR